jgi:hypothetical protein
MMCLTTAEELSQHDGRSPFERQPIGLGASPIMEAALESDSGQSFSAFH